MSSSSAIAVARSPPRPRSSARRTRGSGSFGASSLQPVARSIARSSSPIALSTRIQRYASNPSPTSSESSARTWSSAARCPRSPSSRRTSSTCCLRCPRSGAEDPSPVGNRVAAVTLEEPVRQRRPAVAALGELRAQASELGVDATGEPGGLRLALDAHGLVAEVGERGRERQAAVVLDGDPRGDHLPAVEVAGDAPPRKADLQPVGLVELGRGRRLVDDLGLSARRQVGEVHAVRMEGHRVRRLRPRPDVQRVGAAERVARALERVRSAERQRVGAELPPGQPVRVAPPRGLPSDAARVRARRRARSRPSASSRSRARPRSTRPARAPRARPRTRPARAGRSTAAGRRRARGRPRARGPARGTASRTFSQRRAATSSSIAARSRSSSVSWFPNASEPATPGIAIDARAPATSQRAERAPAAVPLRANLADPTLIAASLTETASHRPATVSA